MATINESFGMETLRASAATVGRPKGVDGKKMSPRRAKMTSREVEHIKTKALKAGGPGSGKHKTLNDAMNSHIQDKKNQGHTLVNKKVSNPFSSGKMGYHTMKDKSGKTTNYVTHQLDNSNWKVSRDRDT